MISLITPTIRKEGLEIVRKALKRQTIKNFNWYIGSKFDPEITEAIWVKDDFEGGFWTLNRIYNKLLGTACKKNLGRQSNKKSVGDHLIISLQDNIWIEKDGIEKFYTCQKETGGLVSGIGNQYSELNERGKPQILSWKDPRKTNKFGSLYECTFPDIEWNWCAIPASAIFDVGGFDEHLDFLGYGMDGYQVNERLNELGYKFFLDQTNESFTLRHDRSAFGGETNWDKNNNLSNGNYEKERLGLIQKGLWPRLNYLSKSVIEGGE